MAKEVYISERFDFAIEREERVLDKGKFLGGPVYTTRKKSLLEGYIKAHNKEGISLNYSENYNYKLTTEDIRKFAERLKEIADKIDADPDFKKTLE